MPYAVIAERRKASRESCARLRARRKAAAERARAASLANGACPSLVPAVSGKPSIREIEGVFGTLDLALDVVLNDTELDTVGKSRALVMRARIYGGAARVGPRRRRRRTKSPDRGVTRSKGCPWHRTALGTSRVPAATRWTG